MMNAVSHLISTLRFSVFKFNSIQDAECSSSRMVDCRSWGFVQT